MDRRHLLGALGTALAVSLAGCTFVLDARSPITAPLPTEHRRVVHARVGAVAGVHGGGPHVRLRRRAHRLPGRDDRTLASAETDGDVPSEAWEGAVTFYPLAAAAERRRYDLAVGVGVGAAFDDLPLGTAVSGPGRTHALTSATAGTCGQAETGSADIVVDHTGSVSTHSTCDDRSE